VVFNDAVLFRVQPHTNKFTLKIGAPWPFVDPISILRLQVSLTASAPVLKTESEFSSVERVTRYVFSSARSVVRVGIPHFALIDGAVVPILHTTTVQNTELQGTVKLSYVYNMAPVDDLSSSPITALTSLRIVIHSNMTPMLRLSRIHRTQQASLFRHLRYCGH